MDDHRTSEDIERGLEQDRAGLTDALDDLREKFSIDGVIRQAVDQVSEHGGDIGASVSRAVKDNPIALAVTGVGLAWLIFGDKAGAAQRTNRGSDGDANMEQYRRATGGKRAADKGDNIPNWLRDDDEDHDGASIADRTRATLGSAGEHASNAADSVRSGVQQTATEAQDRVESLRDRLAEGTEQLSDEGRERVIAAREQVHHARQAAMDHARKGQERIYDMFDEQPLISGALALAVGAAIGAALPRTEFEDENFGAQSDELIREAEQALSEEREKIGAVASAAMDEARDIAKETRSSVEDAVERATPDSDQADPDESATKAMVSKVKDSAQEAGERIANSAKTEADKQNLGKVET